MSGTGGGLSIHSMTFQQTAYVFVLPCSPTMLFGFPQSLVQFAYFISIFFDFLYLVGILSPHQHVRGQDLFLSSVAFKVCQRAAVQVFLYVNDHRLELFCLTSCKESSLRP